MSSRLKILPKKSYCPWSEENVLKVLRDEEKHAREVEAANQRKKQRDREDEDDEKTTNLTKNGHFSLFAKEEKKAYLEQEQKIEGNHRKNKQQHQRPFDQSTSAAMDAAVGLKSREQKHSRRDTAAKKRLDPMSSFSRNYQDDKSDKRLDRENPSRRLEDDTSVVDVPLFRDGKPSKSKRYRGRSHSRRRRRRRRRSSSSSSSSSSDDSTSSPSRRRRRKRRREDSKSRKSAGSTSSSSLSSDDDSSQHEENCRRRGRHSKSRNKKMNRSRNKNDGRSTAMSKEEKAKRELLLRCAQREDQERSRQENLKYRY